MRIPGCLLALFLATGLPAAYAQAPADFQVSRAATPPAIDGDLGDEAWLGNPLEMGQWVTYNPHRGEKVPTRTEVRIVYDDRNIYFAFHCFDDEPDKIRTTVSRRDSVFNDDWIALSLDSAGTGQTAYHLFINPSGVQMDALNTSSGERFEADVIWDSAGKVTERRVRGRGPAAAANGPVFRRRRGENGARLLPAHQPHRHLRVLAGDGARAMGVRQTRPSRLQQSEAAAVDRASSERHLRHQPDCAPRRIDGTTRTGKASFGMSGKYGITSNITLDATVNPDFSQVESDAFQVERQPALPDLLLRETAVLHGGHGALRCCRHRWRQQHAHGRAHPPDHQSRLGQQAHGHGGQDDVRSPQLARRQPAGSWRTGRGDFRRTEAVHARPRHLLAGPVELRRRHHGRYGACRTAQPGRLAGISRSGSRRATRFRRTFLASDTGLGSSSARGTASQATYRFDSRRFAWENQVEHYDTGFSNGYGVLQSHRFHVADGRTEK